MSFEEKIKMLLELVNRDNGDITKNYVNRNELRLFLKTLLRQSTDKAIRLGNSKVMNVKTLIPTLDSFTRYEIRNHNGVRLYDSHDYQFILLKALLDRKVDNISIREFSHSDDRMISILIKSEEVDDAVTR